MRNQSLRHFVFSLRRMWTLLAAIILGSAMYLGCVVSPALAAPATIIPGTTWNDNNGNQNSGAWRRYDSGWFNILLVW